MFEGLRSAIARLTLGPNSGTAFLISNDGLVLTAAHCFAFKGATANDPKWISGETLTLKFGDALAPFVTTSQFDRPLAFDVDEDWAIVKCSPPPPTIPIPLCVPDTDYRGWACWGFPSTIQGKSETEPEAYTGTVTDWGPKGGRVQLHYQQAGPATRVGGMSGAPIVIGGEAVGIMVQSVTQPGPAGVAGEPVLYARLFNVQALKQVRVVVTDALLPLQLPLMDLLALSDPISRQVGDLLKMPPTLAPETRNRAIARHLLTLPFNVIDSCHNVLQAKAKSPRLIARVLCAARLPTEALDAARTNLADSANVRGIVVHAAQTFTPELHAFGARIDQYYEDYPRRVFTLSLTDGKATETGAQLLNKLRARIAAALPHLEKDVTPEELKEAWGNELGEGRPFFVVVTDAIDVATLAPMQAEYPNARFVIRTERPETHSEASLPLVAPAVSAADETTIYNAFRRMPGGLK